MVALPKMKVISKQNILIIYKKATLNRVAFLLTFMNFIVFKECNLKIDNQLFIIKNFILATIIFFVKSFIKNEMLTVELNTILFVKGFILTYYLTIYYL